MSNVLRGTIVNPDTIYGKSAYEIAVKNGFDGTEEEWLDSLTEETANKAEEMIAAEKQAALNAIGEKGATTLASIPEDYSTMDAMVKANALKISRNDKRITNLEKGITPEPYETDASVAYVKDVPEDALPFAEVNIIGGMTYRDGDVLRSAPVTEVESVGANIWDEQRTLGYYDANTGAFFAESGFFASKNKFRVLPNTAYSMTCSSQRRIVFYDINQNYLSGIDYNSNPVITTPSDCYYMAFSLWSSYGVEYKNDIMINKGATALPYAPYVKNTLSIPEAVRPKNGIPNTNVYDYIEWCEDGTSKSYKRVGKVDLGTLDWNGGETNVFYADIDNNLTPKLEGYVGVCSLYDIVLSTTSANLLNKQMVIATLMQTGQAGRTFVKNTAYTDSATFKAAMSGVMLYYELATPEVTDISDILPADNYIGVEGGGTLTFKNEYEYDVPSEVTYQI